MPMHEAEKPNAQCSADPSAPRTILKLKTAPRKPPAERPTVNPAPPQRKSTSNPDARWSDNYKRQMQADMDRLAR